MTSILSPLLPRGATDCHMHVFDPRFPMPGKEPHEVPAACVADYIAVQRRTGLERLVLVQANGYGFDNACMMDAAAALPPEVARMIVVVPPDAPDSLLDRMAEQQVCGIRFHFFPGGFLTWDDLEPLAARAAVRGWHVQVQLDGTTLAEHAERLSHLPCPLVIDHIGKFTQPAGTDHPGFAALLRLVDGGRTFVKLSAPYETSCEGPPGYADVSTLARALAHHAPERMLWATNWPHPWRKERPSEADLIALLADWVPEEHARALVLVTNPAKLYGFGAM